MSPWPSDLDAAEWIAAQTPQDVTFLCGAGVSLDAPAALPTVDRFLAELLTACEAPADLAAPVLTRASLPPVPRFEGLIEEIAKLNDLDFSLARVFDTKTFNLLHSSIAVFLRRGSSVVTTNFDNCFERAAEGAAYERALQLQHERPHIAAKATTLWGLACVAGIRQELEWSLHLFLQARQAFASLGDESNLAWCDYNCADACMNLDRRDEARVYLASAEAAFRRLRSVPGIVYVLWLRAKLHYQAEEYRDAGALLDELRAIASQQGGFLWLLEFVLLYNRVRVRLAEAIDDFGNERFAARLRQLDRKHGRRLERLIAGPTAAASRRQKSGFSRRNRLSSKAAGGWDSLGCRDGGRPSLRVHEGLTFPTPLYSGVISGSRIPGVPRATGGPRGRPRGYVASPPLPASGDPARRART